MSSDATPVRRSVLADGVYEAVKTMVMDHEIAPGARISIDGIAREIGVSPTPVREALARLESDGLARKEPLRGYRATELLTRDELDDLFDFRLLIEPWAARRAAELITAAGADALRAEVETAVVPSAADYRSYQSLASHDHRFHTLLATLSGSEQVRAAFERTHCHLHVFRLYFATDIGTGAVAEHQAVATAVARGDGDAAAKLMTTHLENSRTHRLHTVFAAES